MDEIRKMVAEAKGWRFVPTDDPWPGSVATYDPDGRWAGTTQGDAGFTRGTSPMPNQRDDKGNIIPNAKPVPDYTGDIAAAWELFLDMRETGPVVLGCDRASDPWECAWSPAKGQRGVYVQSDTATEAICRCWLAWHASKAPATPPGA